MVTGSLASVHALGGPTEHPQPNTALHLTTFSLRSCLAAAFGGR
jgi:hypothetical protein